MLVCTNRHCIGDTRPVTSLCWFHVVAGDLPAAAVLYLSTAASSCLVTGGRDEEAWQVLDNCSEVLDELHEAGADAAVWHAAAGVALYHCEDLQVGGCCRTWVSLVLQVQTAGTASMLTILHMSWLAVLTH